MTRLVLVATVSLAALVCGPNARSQSCTVSTTALAFGSYYPYVATTNDATATVTCQAAVAIGVNYTIQLSTGGGGSFTARSMAGPGTRLGYQIYDDSGRTVVWGDGTGSTGTVADNYLLQVLTPVTRNYTAYGRMPAQEQVMPGNYTDSITVLLTYY